jgi:hypothetical protein
MTHHQPTAQPATPPDTATHRPMLDGPDCPHCPAPSVCRPVPAPDGVGDPAGDWWTCEYGHDFVLTPEGLTIPSGDLA